MAVRRCLKCKNWYNDGGPAKKPFCAACVRDLPDDIRFDILHAAPGTQKREEAVRQADVLWNVDRKKGR